MASSNDITLAEVESVPLKHQQKNCLQKSWEQKFPFLFILIVMLCLLFGLVFGVLYHLETKSVIDFELYVTTTPPIIHSSSDSLCEFIKQFDLLQIGRAHV